MTSDCAHTFDVETHFLLDVTFGISDSVASFICTCDTTEGDLALVDADSALVAVPGHPSAGQQHQSRSAKGKVEEDELSSTFSAPCVGVYIHHGRKMSLQIHLG